ncbi:hypothetical protein JCM16358_20740 [Halanaerocella petrolearia]
MIKEADSGQVVWQKSTTDKMRFAIEYIHSVERTPVWDYFQIKQDQIWLVGTKYESYGAGLPFLNKNKYIIADDKFEIKEIDKKLDEIPLRVSDYARHKLIIGNKEYKLFKMVEPKSLVQIRVESRNGWQMLLD